MTANLPDLVERFTGLRLLVVGDAMLDVYLEGTAARICREAPVPIVAVHKRFDAPGGAANTAVNASALGARVCLLGVVGDDVEGALLRSELDRRGVETTHLLARPFGRTLAKQRVLADAHLLLRFDGGDTGPFDAMTEEALVERLQRELPGCDAVIVSDYGYGVLTASLRRALAAAQARSPRLLTLDAKDLLAYREVGVTAVKPNYEEAARLLGTAGDGIRVSRVEEMAACGEQLLDLTGAQIGAITLDKEGALIIERGKPPHRTYAQPVPPARAAGAGDTFLAAFTLALAAGSDTPTAAELASAAAAAVVLKPGTATVGSDELIAHFGEQTTSIDTGLIGAYAEVQRRLGRRIVFTNGCFDILHRGHVAFLNQAKAMGDILIVGVNADESVRRLKGPGRPVVSLEDRMQVLGALSCIDRLVAFAGDRPDQLIRTIRPQLVVKGGNYSAHDLPERALVQAVGGQVRILPYLDDHSTSGIIDRIRGAAAAPPGEPPRAWH